MSSQHAASRHAGRRRRRPGPLGVLVGAGFAAATLLSLSVSGTLADWSTAVIGNNANSAATATAVILQEVGPDGTSGHTQQTCRSSDVATNTSTCATINKYGGTTSPLTPGSSQTTDVTFTNLGAAAATSFALTPGTCTYSPTTGTPTPTNLCTASGELTVAVSCSSGSTYSAGSAWTDLVRAAGTAGSMTTLTHTPGMASGGTATCRFTVALSASASVLDQAVTVTQPLTWTLTK